MTICTNKEDDKKSLEQFSAGLKSNQAVVDDLTMLIRRLVHKLNTTHGINNISEEAMDYLKRHGLDSNKCR